MSCERFTDERFQADKIDVLYGEADSETRTRVEAHLVRCGPCREEFAGFRALRAELAAWRLPPPRPAFAARGILVPRWLALAAALLAGTALGLGASGYVSLRRALAQESARAASLEQRQRQAEQALAALRAGPSRDEGALLARVDARLEERVRESQARQTELIELRFADWSTRAEAQRRLDLARVAEGLSYLDGQHGQQLARTNELMSYVLATASQKR